MAVGLAAGLAADFAGDFFAGLGFDLLLLPFVGNILGSDGGGPPPPPKNDLISGIYLPHVEQF
jgi:hypothetical protein